MKSKRSSRCLWTVFLGGVVGLVGCGVRSPATPGTTAAASTVEQIATIVARQLGVERSTITPETTLAELGADELDFVELVMEFEEHFEIQIPDEVAVGLAGNDQWQEGCKNISMAKLAAVVDSRKGLGPGEKSGAH